MGRGLQVGIEEEKGRGGCSLLGALGPELHDGSTHGGSRAFLQHRQKKIRRDRFNADLSRLLDGYLLLRLPILVIVVPPGTIVVLEVELPIGRRANAPGLGPYLCLVIEHTVLPVVRFDAVVDDQTLEVSRACTEHLLEVAELGQQAKEVLVESDPVLQNGLAEGDDEVDVGPLRGRWERGEDGGLVCGGCVVCSGVFRESW